MCDTVLLAPRHFCRANIKMSIDLCRIANQNFAAQPFRQRDAQRGFSRSCGAQNNDEPVDRFFFARAHRANFQRKSKKSSTAAARMNAPTTWLRSIRTAPLLWHKKLALRSWKLADGTDIRREIVKVNETQLDEIALERRRKRLERARRANRRKRGGIQWLLS